MTGRTRAARQATSARRTIYVVRHAIAAERGDRFPDDAKRPLTRKGIARMRRAVLGFSAFDPKIALILTSPFVRARETAEILAAGLPKTPPVEDCDALTPGHAPVEVAEALNRPGLRRAVALVGHEPDLGHLAAWLIGAREPLVFKKGSIARIDVPSLPPAGDGQLVWLATPRMLRGLV